MIKGPYRTRKLDFEKLAGASISLNEFKIESRAVPRRVAKWWDAKVGQKLGFEI